MSQTNPGVKTFTAAEDLEANRRVKLSTGSGKNVEYADAGDAFIGITELKAPVVNRLALILRHPAVHLKLLPLA